MWGEPVATSKNISISTNKWYVTYEKFVLGWNFSTISAQMLNSELFRKCSFKIRPRGKFKNQIEISTQSRHRL